jgi:hypothetical protein
MVRHEAYYRCRLARSPASQKQFTTPGKTEKQSVKFADKLSESKTPPSKPCAGHLGGLLGAVNKDGRPYVCTRGTDCKFRRIKDWRTLSSQCHQRHSVARLLPRTVSHACTMPFLKSGGRGGLLPPHVRNGIVQAWDTVGGRSHATTDRPEEGYRIKEVTDTRDGDER